MESLFKEKPDKPFILKEDYEEELEELLQETSAEEKILGKIFNLENKINALNEKIKKTKDGSEHQKKLMTELTKMEKRLVKTKMYYNEIEK